MVLFVLRGPLSYSRMICSLSVDSDGQMSLWSILKIPWLPSSPQGKFICLIDWCLSWFYLSTDTSLGVNVHFMLMYFHCVEAPSVVICVTNVFYEYLCFVIGIFMGLNKHRATQHSAFLASFTTCDMWGLVRDLKFIVCKWSRAPGESAGLESKK